MAQTLCVEHVSCQAHARIKFVEALDTGYEKAASVIELIASLYAEESQARELAAPDRLELRVFRSRPVLEQIRTRLEEPGQSALSKGALGLAETPPKLMQIT